MSKLKYGQALLDELSAPVKQIEQHIEKLKKDRKSLYETLERTKDSLEVGSVAESLEAEKQLEAVNKTIVRAENRLRELIDGKGEENHQKAMQVIRDVKQQERHAKQEANDQIAQKVEEIRALYAEIKAYDRQVVQDMEQFAEAIAPYLSKRESPNYGMFQTSEGWLRNRILSVNPDTFLAVCDLYREDKNGISGLIPPQRK